MKVIKPEVVYQDDIREIVQRIRSRNRQRRMRQASIVVAIGLLIVAAVLWRIA